MESLARPDPQRRPAIACAALLGVALVLVAFGRGGDAGRTIDPASVVHTVPLAFNDLPDGTVVAVNAHTGRELRRIAPGEGGFIRVTMRSFAAERVNRGFGREEPFDLIRMSDGDLLLSDRVTGRVMLLDAFGPSNEGVFAQLMEDGRIVQ
jgi:putative photosynthetic complex assembly protein